MTVLVTGLSGTALATRELVTQITLPECGAVVTFEGVTRTSPGGRQVQHLEYESHDRLATTQLVVLAEETQQRWNLHGVIAMHRVGVVAVGEPGVVVAVSAPHRKGTFDACSHLIDRIKNEVAIWKKEVFTDGASQWVGECW